MLFRSYLLFLPLLWIALSYGPPGASIALLLILFHTITWFNLAPRAMPLRLRGKRLPDWMVAAPNYVAWVVISAAVAWLILR